MMLVGGLWDYLQVVEMVGGTIETLKLLEHNIDTKRGLGPSSPHQEFHINIGTNITLDLCTLHLHFILLHWIIYLLFFMSV